MVLAANLLDQAGDCFQVPTASRVLRTGQLRGENARVNCSSPRLVSVGGALDRLGIATRYCAFESCEAKWRIFNERGEQWQKHLFHTCFAQLCAEALDINAW
jgi:hypothetical protein